MQEFNCNNLVFSSSATVYGQLYNSPIKESSKLLPINPYGKTKMVIEDYLQERFLNSQNLWRII